MSLVMGKVDECPFPPAVVSDLKQEVIKAAASCGYHLKRKTGDRLDVPMDFRFLLRSADDPETGLGEYSQSVRVGTGTRMPRLPALYKPKRKMASGVSG